VSGALVPTQAEAEDQEPERLIERGVEARRQGDDQSAFDLFRRAYDLRPSPRAASQLGLAEMALGRWTDAERHLEEGLGFRNDPWIQKNGPVLSGALDRIREHLGSLQILGGPPGSEVFVDGELRGRLPMGSPIRVRSGEHRLLVHAADHVDSSLVIQISPGQLTRETVNLSSGPQPLPGSAHPQRETPATLTVVTPVQSSVPGDSGATLRKTGIALGALGFAAAATGVAFGLKARAAGQENSRPGNTFSADVESSGRRYQTLQYVGYATAGLLAAAGVVAFVVGTRDDRGAAGAQVHVSLSGAASGADRTGALFLNGQF
jgi:hypothetical protein